MNRMPLICTQMLNIEKTQMLTLSRKSILHRGISINVSLDGTDIPQTDSVKYLGVTIDKDLNWKAHTEQVRRKSLAALSTIKRSSYFLPSNICKLLFNSLVRPHLDYCSGSVVWHSCNSTISKRIESIQNYGMCVILENLHALAAHPSGTNLAGLHSKKGGRGLCSL